MCGITGVVYHERQRSVDQQDLTRMCDTLVHRGPDDDGLFLEQNVGLAMRRLSVIDLVTGHQPISNEDGRFWIVFNGEIYNFPEIRSELEQKGHQFSTHTDTETIVHAYEEYGEDCVNRLNGMFAFAIWDRRDRSLFLARDRLGIKPLYYFHDDRCLAFGSELKSILQCRDVPRNLDLEALDSFLTLEYVPAPQSIFKGIRKLLPGHTLRLEDGSIATRRYWSLPCGKTDGRVEDRCEELRELLQDAVRIRLISDVPLGAFLSGGVDSSIIVSMMTKVMDRPVKTFSIGFDDPSYNELEYARLVAERYRTEHHEETIRPDVVAMVSDLIRHLDEPLGDFSIFPTYLVSKLARRSVTVVLSGDGGDELFAGYEWYIADRVERYYRSVPSVLRQTWIPRLTERVPPSARKKGTLNKIKRFVEGAALPDSLQHFRWNTFLTADKKSLLYTDELKCAVADEDPYARLRAYLNACGNSDRLWQQQFADIHTYLVDDILVKVDRMSMANSLEARTPFLDHRVVEFAAGLPSKLKLHGLTTKYILKKTMAGELPHEILHRKKEGFSIPIKNWLREELRPLMEELLSETRLKADGLFDPQYVETMKAEHLKGTANNSHEIWALMVLGIWREVYLN